VTPAAPRLYPELVFTAPCWTADIDFEARIAAIPEHAVARGMFFQYLLEAMGPGSPRPEVRRYVAFKNYPMREYVQLLAAAYKRAFPRLPATEGVRRLGHQIYGRYAATITGTAIFAMTGHSFSRVAEAAPAAYRIVISPGRVSVRDVSDRHARVEFRDVWNLPDILHVGIWEGAMQACGATGTIEMQVHSLCSVDLDIEWTQP
jgi:uncharacterized protein (TIGR02265 family)